MDYYVYFKGSTIGTVNEFRAVKSTSLVTGQYELKYMQTFFVFYISRMLITT